MESVHHKIKPAPTVYAHALIGAGEKEKENLGDLGRKGIPGSRISSAANSNTTRGGKNLKPFSLP